jgi:uncharacterized membrane protein YfcA
MLPIALSLAFLIGASLGLLGGGGSILAVPTLRYVLGMSGHDAIATSLLVVGATSMAGVIVHAKKGHVQWRTGLLFGGTGISAAYLAGRAAHLVPAPLMLVAFSAMMFAAGLVMLRPPGMLGVNGGKRGSGRPAQLSASKMLGAGLAFGAVTGLLGAGGGFLVVPALVLLARLPMATAIGTSLLVITLNSFAGFAGYYGHVTIDGQLALSISAAAVLGSFAGAMIAARLSAQALRQGFGWSVVGMAFFILAREGPPLLGLTLNLRLAALAAIVGVASIAVVRRLLRRPRGGQPSPKTAAAGVRGLHSSLERELP